MGGLAEIERSGTFFRALILQYDYAGEDAALVTPDLSPGEGFDVMSAERNLADYLPASTEDVL